MFTAWVEPTKCGIQINAALTQGDHVSWGWTIEVGNPAMPLNLTGYSIRMTINFPTPLLLTSSNGGITIGTPATNGEFTVNISSTQSAVFTVGEYQYDIWLESQSSPPIENQYFTGSIYINQSITVVP